MQNRQFFWDMQEDSGFRLILGEFHYKRSMFLPYKKIIAFTSIAGFTLLGILAVKPAQERPGYKNLKVLSKNISKEEMDYVMETFNMGLGANCLFCHPGNQQGAEFSIDYATDQLQNKKVARDMLRMTMRLNKKYFNIRMTSRMTTPGRVWCKTCHQGRPVPMLNPAR
jgi:hypothetical protein